MDRTLEIRARQIVREEGYAVHIKCSSEAELQRAEPGGWVCCNCGRVPSDEVADRLSTTEEAAADIRYLLSELDKRELNVHVVVPLVLPPTPVDGQFASTHAVARFLLDGPDVPAALDYGQELRVHAEWTESSEERFKRLLAAEPDPNPAEED
jgi:hypothetical protein